MKQEIFIASPMAGGRIAPFEEKFTVHYAPDPKTRDAVIDEVGSRVRAVVTNGGTGISRDQMNRMPNLEIICAVSAGYENVDVEAAKERDIPITTGAGANAATVGEHAIAMLLALVRGLHEFDRGVRAGGWREPSMNRPLIAGKRMGIIGLGAIGSEVAKRATALGMTVGYNNRNQKNGAPYQYFRTPLELAEWTDVITLNCPGGPATRHIINEQVLAAIGKTGYLINVARGSVVDTPALIQALKNNTIAGAALDVIEGEPDIPPDLLELKNVIFTPHIASRSPEAIEASVERAIQNLEAHFSGKPLLTPI